MKVWVVREACKWEGETITHICISKIIADDKAKLRAIEEEEVESE